MCQWLFSGQQLILQVEAMWIKLVQYLQWVFAEASESFNYQLNASDLLYRSAQIPSLAETYGTSWM